MATATQSECWMPEKSREPTTFLGFRRQDEGLDEREDDGMEMTGGGRSQRVRPISR